MTSCGHIATHKTPKELSTFYQALSKLCLSGEGRGRVHFLQERHLFSYESLLQLKQQRFALAMNLPVYGEELIALTWDSSLPPQWQVTGSFFHRLQIQLEKAVKKQEYQAQLLHDYLSSLTFFFAFYRQLLFQEFPAQYPGSNRQVSCEQQGGTQATTRGICRFTDKEVAWSMQNNQLNFKFSVNTDFVLHVKNFDLVDGFYRRLELFLEKARSGALPAAPLELSLFASDCQSQLN